MGYELGVMFAFGALLFWGFGDFLLQRSTRKFGDWETLFVITLFGAIILTPFIYKDLLPLLKSSSDIWILLIVSVIIFFAALLDYEALKQGKLAIIEPILALEVPVSVILAFTIINEGVGMLELIFIMLIVAGLSLLSLKSLNIKRRVWVEKGVILGILGAIFMGASNFFVGYASRITNPLLTNWFLNVFILVVCTVYLAYNNSLGNLGKHIIENKKFLLGLSILDNGAWIFFAYAAALAPIAIVVALSESYVALAVLLGLMINKEKLVKHQKLGLIISIASAISLAIITI